MNDVRKNAEERASRPERKPVGASFESERQRAKNALVKQLDALDGRNIRKIAAAADAPEEEKVLRVAAYCRVSTDDIDQAISITFQIREYKKKILANPNWKYVGTYVDDGFSGTNTEHRQGFQKLMKDAMDGKIDMIITKAVSRFARNLMDCIGWVEALQNHDPPVRVFFEQENLDTMAQTSFIQQLAFILTDGMDDGGGDYRANDWVEIPSMGAEDYKLPPAFSIPDRVNELVSFLADPKVHPLIKAGVAQAWALVTRPFPEGNERLGRILSNVILLRSGYAYLSDISMSALIARKGYAYYTAMANIMREENAGDLTFFLEYYLELVARAVDERNLRQSKKDEILHTAEVEMAHTVLAQPSQSDSVAIVAEEVNVQSEPQNAAQEEKAGKPELPQEGGEQGQSEDHDAYVIATLGEYAGNENTIIGKLCKHILESIKAGKKSFTVEEVARKNNLKARQFSSSIRRMKDKRIIETDSLHGSSTIYRILFGNYPKAKQPVTVPADCEDEYDPFIIE